MLGFPQTTEFNKRIPKQKFYDNLDVSPTLRRVFVDQIQLIYWRNKLAESTLNISPGQAVKEIEVIEIKLTQPQLDEAVLRQIDKEIPYHKGTMESLNIKPIERAKISCARKLFNEISTENVKYHDVDNYQHLLDVMKSL